MASAVDVVRIVTVVLVAALAAGALLRHRRYRDPQTRWFGLTFAELAVVVTLTTLLPEDGRTPLQEWLAKVGVVGLLAFPYLLYRFTAAFKPPPAWSRRLATGWTIAVCTSILGIPHLLPEGQRQPWWYLVLGVAALGQWVTLTLTAAFRLWRAGRGCPTVTRRRVRLLSLGAGGLGSIMVAGTLTPDAAGWRFAIQIFGLLCVLAFWTGFFTPRLLRHVWRAPEERAVRTAENALMTATTEEEVAAGSLPHLAAVIGAASATLYGRDGRLIGSHGAPESGPGAAPTARSVQSDEITLEFPAGWLVVTAGPYTPLFGQEELSLARALGSLASLALERCEGSARERDIQRQLAEAQALAHIGSWDWNLVDGTMEWSDELYRLFGLVPGEREPSDPVVTERIPAEDRVELDAAITRAREDLQPFDADHRVVLPDGTVRHLHARGRVVADDAGRAIRLVGTAQDVTERHETEARLRASESMFRNVLASAPDAVLGVEEDGRIVLVNEQAVRLFGWSRDELLGKPVEMLLGEELRARHVRHRERYLRDPRTRPMGAGGDLTARRKDGSSFPVDISLSHMEAGGVRLVTAFIRDITSRREAEENVRRLNEARGRQRQAMELNDDIVQGLTVALYALELGQETVAQRAVDETLASARAIVSDLLGEDSATDLGPGDLVRRTPVRLGGAPAEAARAEAVGSEEVV